MYVFKILERVVQLILETQKIKVAKERIRKTKEQIQGGIFICKLELDNLGLKSEDLEELIPIIVEELPNIESLSLDNNDIEILPDSIGDLSRLYELILSNNKLKTLPDSIEYLTELSHLNLYNNKLETLPDVGFLDRLSYVYLNRNRIKSLPDDIYYLPNLCLVKMLDNPPLPLIEVLKIINKNNSSCKFVLDPNNYLEHILKNKNIASRVADRYPAISSEDFFTLFYNLSTNQVLGILEFELPLPELGIGFDSNGKLSNKLALIDTDIPLSELLNRTADIKKVTGKTSIEALNIAKCKPEYLQGIIDFGLSVNQMDQINSSEMYSVYQTIGKKIKETNYRDYNQKMVIGKLTEEDKALSRETFNKLFKQCIPQKAKDKDKVQQQFVEKDNFPVNMVVMVQPINLGRQSTDNQQTIIQLQKKRNTQAYNL